MKSRSAWPTGLPLTDGPFPRISVVTPNFNGAEFLERTLKSVLDQNYPNLEYIVVDGGSSDGSREIIERYRSRLAQVVIERDEGHYDAVAKGFALATGEIFAWLNSDDVYMPWTLRTVAQIFSEHPQCEWITGVPTALHEGVARKVASLLPYPREMIALGLYRHGGLGFIQQESTFWRGALYRAAGGLDHRLKLAGDYELWIRFASHSELVAVSSILGGFSYNGNNRGILQRGTYEREIEEVFARQPAPRRAQAERLLSRLGKARNLCRRWPRLSGPVRFFTGPRGLSGSVLTWDSRDFRYHLARKEHSFYDK